MKHNAIIRICIYSLLLILLVGLLLGGLNSFGRRRGGGPDSHAEHVPLRVDDSSIAFDPSQVTSLDIDWAAGGILIQRDDGDTIRISEQAMGDAEPMYGTLKDGQLKIDFTPNKRDFIGISNVPTKNLTVTVPQKWDCRELDLDVASSNVTVENLTIDKLEFDGADGNLDLKNCKIGDFDMDSASGDVFFSGSLDTLDMDGASCGFVGIFENCPARLTIDGMSGSLDVTLPKDTGFTARLDGMSCHFISDFPVRSQNNTYAYGDGQCKIQADGMSVDVIVRFPE